MLRTPVWTREAVSAGWRRGRFAAFDWEGVCVAQGRKPEAALDKARRKGIESPILIDLDIRKKRTYAL